MPTKTIYISKNDLPVFEEAKKKAGKNLSPVITKALNEYLGRQDVKEEAGAKGFAEITITLGSAGYERQKRFMGKRLLSTFDRSDRNDWRGFTIYETLKGQYVVVGCSLPDPWVLETGVSDQLNQAIVMDDDPEVGKRAVDVLMGYGDGNFTEYATSYSMTICPTLEDIAKAVPARVFNDLQDKLEQIKNPVEYLDI